MWIFTAKSFISVVADLDSKDKLLVRARVDGHIQALFPTAKVWKDKGADYLYRALVEKKYVMKIIASQVGSIEYPNFKESVDDWELHQSYLDVWHVMHTLQVKLNGHPSIAGL